MEPLANGGKDEWDNMLPACRSCYKYKHTLDVEGFRAYLEGIPKRLERDCVAYQVGARYGIVRLGEPSVKFYFEKEHERNE